TFEAAGGAFPLGLTDAYTVYNVPSLPRPGYMYARPEPTFGTTIMRIAGDVGTLTAPITGVWGMDARHVYSKQQPLSSDGSLISMQNRSGGSPSVVLLDGNTFQVKGGACPNYDL